ncbi:cell division protein FtsZ [Sinomicrobium weinanense]|uniref:Cell division protein FtsZ n=1 Tax=Sinomicrobium weinanense TaxID=2842200 RepID=A0A926Q330_9FLAO|nr:cell division protein FtsZ [Sinomicrobium weinanense]MBC9797138.1 cell division protein FtsZ [Sinomicrobium weinanense]MBU3124839.1 cell division protein FtsZ [Sinomicrobium weinanense]
MSSNTDFGNISFDMPKNQSNVIKVIGVGGGGSNAINHMFQMGIKGVDFVVCNTDSQALDNSPVPNKIQLGVALTEGLGAGANPEVGEKAAIESFEDIKGMLDSNTKMLFITAGMGGGTGTGAAPILAKMAKEMDILTVGIVTIPFQFEGKMRNEQARRGVENLRSHVDSLIVINNNKLREVYGNLGFKAGFSKADEVLATASRGIAEVITHHYTQNIDLRDAKTVLSNSGTAIMGSASASGGNRAQDAIVKALDSPLLNDNKITGAKNVLLLIVSGGEEITIDEIGEINDHIQNEAGNSANIIMGVGEDDSLGDAISVTVIATGFNIEQQHEIVNTEAKKIIHTLEDEQKATQNLTPDKTASTMNFPGVMAQPQREEKKETTIKHTLTEEDKGKRMDLVPTTDLIKDINVVYDEVYAREEDFVIIDTTENIRNIDVQAEEVQTAEQKEQQQTTLSFDMPLSTRKSEPAPSAKKENNEEKTNVFTFDMDRDAKDYDVKDHVEVVPVTEVSEEGVRRYSLDDYMEMENKLSNAQPKSAPKKNEIVDKELAIEKKVVNDPVEGGENKEVDPFNTSIEESLKLRAEERRKKLKEFNYKFNNNSSKIDEIEKQPAYKRMGVELHERTSEDGTSRISVGKDSNDDIQLRSNNSFLHDNVD